MSADSDSSADAGPALPESAAPQECTTSDSSPISPIVEFDAKGVPAELKELPHWVAWMVTPPKKPGAKFGKVPINPHTGGNASSTNSKTWSSLAKSLVRATQNRLGGVGFMFSNSPYAGIDLDHCRDPDTAVVADWALEIVRKLATYTEISPSGKGLHLIVRAKLPGKGRRLGDIEVYDTARFFTITGVRLPDTPEGCADRQEETVNLYASLVERASASRGEKMELRTEQETRHQLSDDEIIERAHSAKNGWKFKMLWSGDTSNHPSHSEADLALCGQLAFWTGRGPEQIDRLFRRSGLMREKWDEQHGGQTYGAMTIAQALSKRRTFWKPRSALKSPEDALDSTRPRIIVRPGRQHEAVLAAEDVLLAQPQPLIFQRDRLLVRRVTLKEVTESGGLRRPAGSTVVEPVDSAYLINLLTRLIDWRKEGAKGLYPIDAPSNVVEALLASCGDWRLSPLLGVIEAPTMRKDGTLLLANGYDASTGLLLDYVGPDLPAVADRPSREDALAALQVIERLFEHFPFVAACDRSVLTSVVLTSLVRRTLRTAPLFLFRAPARGSGKSLLADCIALIATGRPCAAMTAGQDFTEERKQLFSILLEGDLIVCIDNVERPLSSPDLCVALTQRDYKGRLLGHSRTVKVPTNVLWMATGNNLLVEGDLVSRVLTCDLDPQCEAPESREFAGDLREQILEQRGAIIHAALTILRAYHVANRPAVGLPAFGRFEEWSRTVRAPVVWLGRADPLETAARLRRQDPATNRLQALLHAWHAHFRQPTTVSALVRLAVNHKDAELFEPLFEIGGLPAGGIDHKVVGTFVRMNAGRIVDRMSLERVGTTKGSARWSVRVHGGDGGDGGDPTNPPREVGVDSDLPRAHARAHAREGVGEVPPVPPNHVEGADAQGGDDHA